MFDPPAAFSGATMLNGMPSTRTVPVFPNSNDSFFAVAFWKRPRAVLLVNAPLRSSTRNFPPSTLCM